MTVRLWEDRLPRHESPNIHPTGNYRIAKRSPAGRSLNTARSDRAWPPAWTALLGARVRITQRGLTHGEDGIIVALGDPRTSSRITVHLEHPIHGWGDYQYSMDHVIRITQ